jgi:hypothetical protein
LILRWKQNRSQQGLQENSSGQSFFVRNKKVRREEDEIQGSPWRQQMRKGLEGTRASAVSVLEKH